MASRKEFTKIFKNNPRLAELNPGLATEVLSGSNSPRTAATGRPGTLVPSGPLSPEERQAALKAKGSGGYPPLTFTIPGEPVAKPRQTKSDKWKKRPSVMKYRAWADSARREANKAIGRRFPGLVLASYARMQITAFLPIPSSWNKTMKARMKGKPHQQTPDADNLIKAAADALFPTGDSQIWDMRAVKHWDDGEGPRVVVMLF